MQIVYIILAHKLPDQLIRLVKKLDSPSATFLIHIDKKAKKSAYKQVSTALSDFKNVYFQRRHSRYYGDYNHVQATLDAIHMLKVLGISYDYVLLLTGQDYPIKSNSQIQDFFQQNQGKSFMEYFQLPSHHWKDEDGGLDRINYWHLHWRGSEFAFLKKKRYLSFISDGVWGYLSSVLHFRRKLPEKFKWYGGSAYWCLSQACIDYIYEFVQNNSDFVRFFAHVKIAEEIFFQTILLNSPLKGKIVDDNLRFIEWADSRHPPVLSQKDFERFMDTKKMFARKFDVTKDAEVLSMIDQATSE